MQGPKGESFSRQLERVEHMLSNSIHHLILPQLFHDGLQFLQPPSKGMSSSPTPDALALTPFVTKNLFLLSREASLDKCSEILSRILPSPNCDLWERFQSCNQRLDVEKNSSMNWKRKEWEQQYWVETEPYTVDPGVHMRSPLLSLEPSVALSNLTVLNLHFLAPLSLKDSNFLLSVFSLQSQILASIHPSLIPFHQSLDAQVVIDQMNLCPKMIKYACCPDCFSLFDISTPYPTTCIRRLATEEAECGSKLRTSGSLKPHCEYVMCDFKDWLSRFYARADIEIILDRSTSNAAYHHICDVWDGEALRNFGGPDDKLFLDCPPGESRLVFSIHVEKFGYITHQQGEMQVTRKALCMVCLNLPLNLRYRPENIYLVGVIPGLSKPSAVQMNHILSPLIDVLLEMWHNGLFLRHTPKHPFGRRSRVAVVPLVADIHTGRKMAGFGSCTCKHFCSYCHTTIQDMDNIEHLSWTSRRRGTLRDSATEWRDAATVKTQAAITKVTGVRWSELFRLPYWDPTCYLGADPKDLFYLGLFQHHIREVWGMNDHAPDGPSDSRDAEVGTPPAMEFPSALDILHRGDFTRITQSTTKDAAESILVQEYRQSEGQQKSQAEHISPEIVRENTLPTAATGPRPALTQMKEATDPTQHVTTTKSVLVKEACVLEETTVSQIMLDIIHTIFPSWVTRGPSHPSSVSQGNLLAGEWCTFSTINLVITLTRLWGKSKESREARMLENFLHLVSVVKYASLRKVDETSIRAYESHMYEYLRSLLELFPGTSIVPNQHMALHFGSQLRLFGPQHRWRGFSFENIKLDQMNTSNDPIEHFYIKQQLRALLDPPKLPAALHPFIPSFRRCFDSEPLAHGIDLSTTPHVSEPEVLLPQNIYALLREWQQLKDSSLIHSKRGYLLKSIVADVAFTTFEHSESDSYVMFRLSGDPAHVPWRAGTITHIVLWQKRYFFVVEPFKPANPEESHPFVFHQPEKFGFITGYLFYVKFHLSQVLLTPDQLIGHFAYSNAGNYFDCSKEILFQALPLEQVQEACLPHS